MSYFVRSIDAYARRYEVSARDRRKLLRRYPLFKLYWWSHSGKSFLRKPAAALLRLFKRSHLTHHLRAPGGGHVQIPVSFDDAELATFREIFLAGEYDAPFDISGARTVVDLGANTGMASLYFLANCSLERLVAVEANPGLGATLARNLSQFEPAELEAVAIVGEEPADGTVRFSASDNPRHGNARAGGDIEVPATSLRALLDRHGLARADILKMDIEGSEHDVIEKDGAVFERFGAVFAEVHGDAARRAGFNDRLRARGFEIVRRVATEEAGCETIIARRAE